MTLPTWVASGTIAATATNAATLTPSPPNGAIGDLLILVLERQDGTAAPTVTGWTNIASATGVTGALQSVATYWKIATSATGTSDNPPAITFGSSTVLRAGRVFRFANTSAVNPIHLATLAFTASTATTVNATNLTSTVANTTGVFLAVMIGQRTTTNTTTNWTAGAGVTAFASTNSTTGNDSTFGIGVKQFAAAGSYLTPGIVWTTNTTTGPGAAVLLALNEKQVPNAPASSAATSVADTSFTANWSAPSTDSTHDAADGYYLEVATDSGFTSHVNTNQNYGTAHGSAAGFDVGAATSFSVTGLADNTTYYYRVWAYNANAATGNGSASTTQTLLTTVVTSAALAATAGLTTSVPRVTVQVATAAVAVLNPQVPVLARAQVSWLSMELPVATLARSVAFAASASVATGQGVTASASLAASASVATAQRVALGASLSATAAAALADFVSIPLGTFAAAGALSTGPPVVGVGAALAATATLTAIGSQSGASTAQFAAAGSVATSQVVTATDTLAASAQVATSQRITAGAAPAATAIASSAQTVSASATTAATAVLNSAQNITASATCSATASLTSAQGVVVGAALQAHASLTAIAGSTVLARAQVSWLSFELPTPAPVGTSSVAATATGALATAQVVTASAALAAHATLNASPPGNVVSSAALVARAGLYTGGYPAPGTTTTSGTINSHSVVVEQTSHILSWLTQASAFPEFVRLQWQYLTTIVPTVSGAKLYLRNHGFELTTDGVRSAGHIHNPPMFYGAMMDSLMPWFAYSGDSSLLAVLQEMLDYQLAHGLTSNTWNWPSCPWSTSPDGNTDYTGDTLGLRDGINGIEPDKMAEFALACLRYWQLSGTTSYRTTAIALADVLVAHRVTSTDSTHSPWPFRVNAQDGSVIGAYTAHMVSHVRLFDELIRLGLGSTSSYQTARDAAWTWVMTYPMSNNNWTAYFEDIGEDVSLTDHNNVTAMETARYIMARPDPSTVDASWQTHVPALIAWVVTTLGDSPVDSSQPIQEQEAYPYPMPSHTSRWASVNALWWSKGGAASYLEAAYRAFNYSTYFGDSSGRVRTELSNTDAWYSDGYGDLIRHLMAGIAANPYWATPGENHIVGSTSVVTAVTYATNLISYSTFDSSATETIRPAFTPTSVTANGSPLQQRWDLNAEGWTFIGGILKVRHDAATAVVVSTNVSVGAALQAQGRLATSQVVTASAALSASASLATAQQVTAAATTAAQATLTAAGSAAGAASAQFQATGSVATAQVVTASAALSATASLATAQGATAAATAASVAGLTSAQTIAAVATAAASTSTATAQGVAASSSPAASGQTGTTQGLVDAAALAGQASVSTGQGVQANVQAQATAVLNVAGSQQGAATAQLRATGQLATAVVVVASAALAASASLATAQGLTSAAAMQSGVALSAAGGPAADVFTRASAALVATQAGIRVGQAFVALATLTETIAGAQLGQAALSAHAQLTTGSGVTASATFNASASLSTAGGPVGAAQFSAHATTSGLGASTTFAVTIAPVTAAATGTVTIVGTGNLQVRGVSSSGSGFSGYGAISGYVSVSIGAPRVIAGNAPGPGGLVASARVRGKLTPTPGVYGGFNASARVRGKLDARGITGG